MDEWMCKWMGQWMNEWVSGWKHEWMHKWINGQRLTRKKERPNHEYKSLLQPQKNELKVVTMSPKFIIIINIISKSPSGWESFLDVCPSWGGKGFIGKEGGGTVLVGDLGGSSGGGPLLSGSTMTTTTIK